MIIKTLQKGFTLIEVLASIGIFLVIIVSVGLFESNVFSYQRNSSGSFQTVQDAQVILKTIAKDIRMISQGSDGSYALQTVATNTLMFFADVNGNGIKERIRYTLIGPNLYRTLLIPAGSPLTYNGTESTSTILTDVANGTSSAFMYYNGSYFTGTTTGTLAQPVTPNSVRMVEVSLTLRSNSGQVGTPHTYVDYVTLRNLKDNL